MDAVLAGGSQSPLENIPLDVDRSFQLPELLAVCLRANVDNQGSGLHLCIEVVGQNPFDASAGYGQVFVDRGHRV